MGKGSNRRQEDTQKVRDNWDAVFGKRDQKQEKPNTPLPKNNAK